MGGYEQTQWWVHTDKVHIRYGGKKSIVDQNIPLVSFFGNELAVGCHKIDFGFILPATLPGAFMWYHGDWFARVEYKLKAKLTAVNKSDSIDFAGICSSRRRRSQPKRRIGNWSQRER